MVELPGGLAQSLGEPAGALAGLGPGEPLERGPGGRDCESAGRHLQVVGRRRERAVLGQDPRQLGFDPFGDGRHQSLRGVGRVDDRHGPLLLSDTSS
ncbi:hypothetical protein BRC60_00235 [Halobacteriales archaeon QH_1_68_42]|nr:MAG: hypothetical protein BRC60_00235 [Halobacteriales archaeon QH_1_68_42]